MIEWFETGTRPQKGEMGRVASRYGKRIRETLKGMGKKKPTKESLTQALDGLLETEPPPVSESETEGGAV